jgi:hypothetical protein
MSVVTVAVIVAAVGALAGLTIRNAVVRRAGNPPEASRRSQLLVSIGLLVGAAILGVNACTDEPRRYLNIAIAAIMTIIAIWQLTQLRRQSRTR